ncbi:hypothetical protein ACSS7Z_15020 [Microbacterium sp. A82]|uniref:hypothetical protein n=1 Tax=Microbacterium sp. A82 TaxID=3450452 RepID=UPI003F3839E5
MIRHLRNSDTHRSHRARFVSLAGVIALSVTGLFFGAPAHADSTDAGTATLAVQCEDEGFWLEARGTFVLDATTAESFIAVDGEAGESEHWVAEPGIAFEGRAKSVEITDDVAHHVEWFVNGKGVAEGDFSRAESCDEATPTPTDSPDPSPTPTESPEPTKSREPTPAPTTSPEPTPVPTDSPAPTKTPVPSEPTETPQPVETPAPAAPDTPAPVQVKPTVSLSSASVPAATSVTVNSSGFQPGEKLELWLRSQPWKLTDATADANGDLSLSVGIAGGTEIGAHTIEVRGATSGSVFVDIVVTDDLAITGIDSAFASGVATTGLALVIGGTTVVLLGRRASREAASSM